MNIALLNIIQNVSVYDTIMHTRYSFILRGCPLIRGECDRKKMIFKILLKASITRKKFPVHILSMMICHSIYCGPKEINFCMFCHALPKSYNGEPLNDAHAYRPLYDEDATQLSNVRNTSIECDL